MRTVERAFESRLPNKISGRSCIIPRLVMSAGRCLNRGKTAYRREKGKEFRGMFAEFGKSALYLKPGTKDLNELLRR